MLSQYQLLFDVDDIKLAIFSACYSSLKPSWDYGLPDVAKARGIDATIAFPDLVYSPLNTDGRPMDQTRLYGGYFWERAAEYLKTGATSLNAMKWATSDMIAKDGKGWGYELYQISGSVTNPGAVGIKPAAAGTAATSDLLWDAQQYSISSLNTTSTSQVQGPSGPMTLVETLEGVMYRLDHDGRLVDVNLAARRTGTVTYDIVQARTLAETFATQHAVGFSPAWTLAEGRMTHVEGEDLARFVWRPSVSGHPASRLLQIEVDLRTGAVTHYIDALTAPPGGGFEITAQEAIDIVRQQLGTAGEILEVIADTWHHPRWSVTLDLTEPETGPLPGVEANPIGERSTPRVIQVHVDATTGEILDTATT